MRPAAHPVDSTIDGLPGQQPGLECPFFREVDHQQSDHDGEDALPGEDEHHDSADDESRAQQIPQNGQKRVSNGTTRTPGGHASAAHDEMIHRKPCDDDRQGDQGRHEGDHAQDAQAGEEHRGMCFHPVDHRHRWYVVRVTMFAGNARQLE
tara:strand:- start:119 stop:571 length:453 start_codon:yes stop_codon:yes gene_type:complete